VLLDILERARSLTELANEGRNLQVQIGGSDEPSKDFTDAARAVIFDDGRRGRTPRNGRFQCLAVATVLASLVPKPLSGRVNPTEVKGIDRFEVLDECSIRVELEPSRAGRLRRWNISVIGICCL
jgi:hypothetical protein